MITILTLVTCLTVVILLAVVAAYVHLITVQLRAIGGTPTSYLGKIRFGLRAIEKETAVLAPYVAQLNQGLGTLDHGLRGVERDLAATVDALRERAK